MIPADDDGIVVGGGRQGVYDRITLTQYLAGPETNRPQELAYGILREPAAPGYNHQIIVGRVHLRLDRHVQRYGLGEVVESPVDVILDRRRALVVQPDVVFVSSARLVICRKQIWGAPDLVVEVLSDPRSRHDRVTKVGWYRRHGVRECWIADPIAREIEVLDLAGDTPGRVYEGRQTIRSIVLPLLRMRAEQAFPPFRVPRRP